MDAIVSSLACPKCSSTMEIVSYSPVFKILKERSWHVCTNCDFERSVDDYVKGILTV